MLLYTNLGIISFFNAFILFFAIVLMSSYLILAFISVIALIKYLKENKFINYKVIKASDLAPHLSLIAPAYNEEKTIRENVHSLLTLNYNNYEVIVVNDGSLDNSLETLINAYNLEEIKHDYNQRIKSQEVKAVYKSKNPAFDKLIVIDKINGGKSDALNAGINISTKPYIICIDVDCVLNTDALLILAKPFLSKSESLLIATGGVIRISNSCVIEDGSLIKINVPDKLLPRVQVIEYLRAFLLGRMAWSKLDGLLIISGAFGMFDKEIAIKAGGYYLKTVGEDMELVIRMRRYMIESKQKYSVTYIPNPLCWTEAPETFANLRKQRSRWTRGTMETLWIHRKMFLNPKYKILGLLSVPYWFVFEYLAPIIEFTGLLITLLFAIFGILNWKFFLLLLLFVYFFAVMFSVLALLIEEYTYHQYPSIADFNKLMFGAIIEPFYFHLFTVYSALIGNWEKIAGNKGWGDMTRKGYAQSGERLHAQPDSDVEKLTLASELRNGLYAYLTIATGWLILLVLLRVADFVYNGLVHQYPQQPIYILTLALLNDMVFFLKANVILSLLYGLIFLISKRIADIVIISLTVILTLGSIALMQYFSLSFVPLGADLYGYSNEEIKQTIGASGGISMWLIPIIALVVFGLLAIYKWVSPLLSRAAKWINLIVSIIAIVWVMMGIFSNKFVVREEYADNLTKNKLNYFLAESYEYLFPTSEKVYNTNAAIKKFFYVDEVNYPFLRKDSTADVLSPFLNTAAQPPNIVIVIVEGLGRAFTNNNAYLGSFTPFLDSLSRHSLYWENFLSNGGRTFAALPSVLGSLPLGNTDFNEFMNKIPPHLTLMSILKSNGYQTSFYYGGDAGFDNMAQFLRKQHIDNLFDKKTFPPESVKLPENNGTSWGFGDKELFRHVLNKKDGLLSHRPFLQVMITLASHNSFIINEQEYYLQQFEERMDKLIFSEAQKEEHRKYQLQYSSILYADDAIRGFINSYRTKPGFENTIFLITGDHRMPEIPMATKIDRYHVPMIIYSPLLKRSDKFESISSHVDITPTLLAYLKHTYNLRTPSMVSWVGSGIDTANNFRNIHHTAFKQTKNNFVDFMMGNYHLNQTDVFKLTYNMGEDPDTDPVVKVNLQAAIAKFKQKNEQLEKGKPLIPDSIYTAYSPR